MRGQTLRHPNGPGRTPAQVTFAEFLHRGSLTVGLWAPRPKRSRMLEPYTLLGDQQMPKLNSKKDPQHRAPTLSAKIVGVETVDHPTDGELVAHARRFFKADSQMPPRIR